MSNAVMPLSTLQALSVFPLADRFPYLPEAELLELTQSIGTDGLHHPIVLFENQILDGRNRLKACADAGLDAVPVIEFDGTWTEAVFFVLAENVQRRHLDPAFRAGLATDPDVLEAFRLRAAANQGTRTDLGHNIPQKIVESSDQMSRSERETRAMAAEAVGGTNREYVRQMSKLREADPDLFDSIMAGEKKLTDAWRAHKAPGGYAYDGATSQPADPHDRFDRLVDSRISGLSDLIAEHAPIMREDERRKVVQALQNLIRLAEAA